MTILMNDPIYFPENTKVMEILFSYPSWRHLKSSSHKLRWNILINARSSQVFTRDGSTMIELEKSRDGEDLLAFQYDFDLTWFSCQFLKIENN